jgi:diguanylate cyclase (GGDEF)-like protein
MSGTDPGADTDRRELEAGGVLRHSYLFSLLSDREIADVLPYLHGRFCPAGHVIFREGDPGEELFIIERGRVEISISLPDGSQRTLREFTAGDFFGEMSIVEGENRSATARALEPVELGFMKKADFFGIMQDLPAVAIKVMHRMYTIATERLHSTSEFLEEMVLWGEQARKRAVTDSLTGVYNRQFLDSSLPRMLKEAGGRGGELALIMVDLDHFRVLNDTWGQEAGDRVLRDAVSVITRFLRKPDVLARYGGNEFTILLPGTGVEGARRIAENIREGVARMDLAQALGTAGSDAPGDAPVTRVTTSQGVAVYPVHAGAPEELREQADRALYRSKELGRDRVSIAGTG